MAITYRRRHNLVGVNLGAALATGATSITFDAALKEGGSGGSNIATLGTDEYLPLTIENEVVYLTAYTLGATSGTIARAKEDTVDPGIDHANGTAVKHCPTKRDTVRFRSTTWGPSTAKSTSSTSYVDIDATNLPVLPLTLLVGDQVELELTAVVKNTSDGNVVLFDWDIDQPTSANTNIRTLVGSKAAMLFVQATAGYDQDRIVRAVFTCTEAGVHTFKPQWRVGGGTATIRGVDDANYSSPVTHTVKNFGQQTGA